MEIFNQGLLTGPINTKVSREKYLSPDRKHFAIKLADTASFRTDADLDPQWIELSTKTEISRMLCEDGRKSDLGRKLRDLYHDIQAWKLAIRDAYRELNRSRYDSIVRHHTRLVMRYVKVKPLRYEEVLSPKRDIIHRHRVADEVWTDKLDYLHRRLDVANRPEHREKFLGAIRFLEAHPEKNEKFFKKVVVGWKEVLSITPAGYYGSQWMPVVERKLVPLRDWPAIWQEWSALKQRCAKRAAYFQRQLLRFEATYAELRARYYGKPKQVFHEHLVHPVLSIPPYQRVSGSGLKSVATRPVTVSHPDETRFPTLFMLNNDRPSSSDFTGAPHLFFPPGEATRCTGFQNFGEGAAVFAYQDRSSSPTSVYFQAPEAWVSNLVGSFDPEREENPDMDYMPTFIDHSKESAEEDDEILRERRISSNLQLRNLKTSRAALVNTWRSLGEQKDNSQLLHTFCSFGSYLKGSPEGYLVRRKSGVRYISMDTARGRVLGRIYAMDSARKAKHLRVLGISFLRPVRATTVSIAAALYLSWKFGAEQSIHDAHYILNHWGTARAFVRECLTHLQPNKFGVVTPRVRYAAPLRDHRLSNKQPEPSIKGTEKVIDRTISETVSLIPLYEAILQGKFGRPDQPEILKETSLGLPILRPTFHQSAADYEHWQKAYAREESKLVERLLLQFFKKEKLPTGSYVIHLDRTTRGSIFANYSRSAITRGMAASIGNLIEDTRLLETAWELAPLSFVVEWFSNVGVIVRGAQEILSAHAAKLSPIGSPWETLRSDLYMTPVKGSFECSLTVDPQGPWWFLGIVEDVPAKPEVEYKGMVGAVGKLIPSYVRLSLHIKWSPEHPAGSLWSPPRRLAFCRRPWQGEQVALPDLRFRLNLDAGKLGSLLAMWASTLK